MSQQRWPNVRCRPVGAFGNTAPMMDAASAAEAGAAVTPPSQERRPA